MATDLDLIQDDLEHQIGPMGLGPDSEIGGEQVRQIELVDRRVDGAGAMVGGQGVLDLEPLGGETIPGRRCKAIECGIVPAWGRVERRAQGAGAARRLRPRMVLRSRREYHDSRAPFVGGAGDHPHSKTRESSFAITPRIRRKRDDLWSVGGDIARYEWTFTD